MQAELAAAPREMKGKKAAKQMRRDGRIPGVLYGHDFDSMLISIERREFKTLVRHDELHGLLNLKVEGVKDGKYTVVVKEVQRHPTKDDFLHIDFQRIRSDEELVSDVTLHFVGEPVGIKAGGILQHYLYAVTVQCLPNDLPESIEVDITNLELKENLRIHDLVTLEGVRYQNNPDEIVAAVLPKRVRDEISITEEGEVLEEEAAEEAAAAEEESSKQETE
jgi:large subunit ribosomal protein L25